MECYQTLVEVADERSVAVEDTSWDQTCQLPDKGHVNALLDISEDTSFKDQEPYEFLCLPGWDEAVSSSNSQFFHCPTTLQYRLKLP